MLTGGLGLAAIQLAQAAGAVPIGTAGSTHKQGYMGSLGVADVASSRSTEFTDVLGPANAQGSPRMVLNSLTSPGASAAPAALCMQAAHSLLIVVDLLPAAVHLGSWTTRCRLPSVPQTVWSAEQREQQQQQQQQLPCVVWQSALHLAFSTLRSRRSVLVSLPGAG